MYKRRDWLHLHGEDGGASDSSDDSGSELQRPDDGSVQPSGSSDSEADSSDAAAAGAESRSAAGSGSQSSGDDSVGDEDGSLGGYESEVSEPVGRRRLEDLSEEDFDSGDDDSDLEEVKRTWLDAAAEHKPAGRALKCQACNGKLLLNALALQQHIASKRHLRKATDAGDEPTDSICFADQLANNENVETHQERMQRLQQEDMSKQQSAVAPAGSKSSGAAKRRQKQQRKAAAAGAAGSKAPKKRLGKRQRAALKQDGPAAASSGGDLSKHSKPKRRKLAKA